MKDPNNIYLQARMEASRRDRLFANRERAAERLHVSAEALSDYENGETLPPCDAVQWMIEVYGAPDLKAKHMRACCPLMCEGLPDDSNLMRAALGWVAGLRDADELGAAFAKVALDGAVTPDEKGQADAIRARAVELTRIMLETIAAIDAASNGGRQI